MEALKNKFQSLQAKRQERDNDRQSLVQLSDQLAEKAQEYQEVRQLLIDGLANNSLTKGEYQSLSAQVKALKAQLDGLNNGLENAQNRYSSSLREAIELQSEIDKELEN